MVRRIINTASLTRLFHEFFTRQTLKQLSRYLVVGFLTVGLEFLNLRLLTEVLGLWYITSNSIAYVISFAINYTLNRIWSFGSKGALKKQLVMYGVLFVVNLVLSNVMMYLFTDIIGMKYMVSKLFAVGAVVSWNFVLYKKVIYK